MKSISLDFKNRVVCILNDAQQGTERNPDLKKVAFHSFIPEQCRNGSSFAWDFENDTFSVNKEYELKEGCIMTKECFEPELTIPMPGLNKRYEEFIAIMGYEEYDLVADMPSELKDMLGL